MFKVTGQGYSINVLKSGYSQTIKNETLVGLFKVRGQGLCANALKSQYLTKNDHTGLILT